jgi:type VI protein secretion system component VasK
MLFPRFTIRTILAVMALCAVLFLLVGTAYRGQTWAWAATIGVLSLGVTALVHGACFAIVWCFAQLPSAKQPTAHERGLAPARQEDPS